MYIEAVPNRNSPPAVLLRESYRRAGKVRKRTLANLSKLPQPVVEGLRTLLRGGSAVADLADALDITRSLPHGHVAAVLGTLRDIGLDRLIAAQRSPQRDRVLAMIAARILHPASKLATARRFAEATASDSLAETLGLGDIGGDDLYEAMDWLLARQEHIERGLAKRHLGEGSLVLYDLTSVYMEGRKCPLAKRGYSRDGKKGRLQIEFGLLCDAAGRPVAVEVFEGNTADPATLGPQIDRLRERFGLSRVVLVGDRGMLAEARIREEVVPAGLDWISALRAPAIQRLAESGAVQPSLFDERDLVEVRSDLFPGERLMVCRNPLLAAERARKREALLDATETLLAPIAAATRRASRRLAGRERIGERVGRVIHRHKVGKHIDWHVDDAGHLRYHRNHDAIAAEAALDGLYVVRTSLPEAELDATGTVRAYKRLGRVERAFRSIKTVDLKVRPVFHRTADRVRAHVLLCMLAYHVEWHMRDRLAPLLFDDTEPADTEASAVAAARRSGSALRKAASGRTGDGLPVHSFHTPLADLATVARNRVEPRLPDAEPFDILTRPTGLQNRAFELLGVHP